MECSSFLKCDDKKPSYGGDLLRDYYDSIDGIGLLSPENEKAIAKRTLKAKELFYDYLLHNDYVLKSAVDCFDNNPALSMSTYFAFPREKSSKLLADGIKKYLCANIEIVRQAWLENSRDYLQLINCKSKDSRFELLQGISRRTENGVKALKEINFKPNIFYGRNHRYLEKLMSEVSIFSNIDGDNRQGSSLILESASNDFHMPLDDFRNYLIRLDLLLKGYKEVRDEFINANLRLVISVAKQLVKKNESLIDLIQDGNIGLIKAVDGFNPLIDGKFSTFATQWIKNTIINSRYNFAGKSTKFKNLTKVLSKNLELIDERGRAPDCKKLAEEAGVEEKVVKQITGYYFRKQFSIFDIERHPEQFSSMSFIDCLISYEDKLLADPERRLASIEKLLNSAFPTIDKQIVSDRLPKGVPVSEVIKMYYGFNPYEKPYVLRDLSEKFSISPEGIRLMIVRYQNALETYLSANAELVDLLFDD